MDPKATESDNVLLKLDMDELDKNIHEVERELAGLAQVQRLEGIDAGDLSHLRAMEVHLRQKELQMRDEWLLLSNLMLLRKIGEKA